MIYEPREDSYLLQKFVKQFAKGSVLDLGTGSGLQAETASETASHVVAADINEEAVTFVKKKGITALVSDLFTNITGKFDLIIFNPPYLPRDAREDAASEQITTGGKRGHELLERFLVQAKKYLEKDGKILIVTSSLTGDIPKLLKIYNYAYKILGEEKISFETLTVYLLEP